MIGVNVQGTDSNWRECAGGMIVICVNVRMIYIVIDVNMRAV